MAAMYFKVPVLTLLPSLDGSKIKSQIPAERELNRSMLVNVAPDREELLRTTAIEEIRQSLKLRVGPSYPNWLHYAQNKHDSTVENPTTRMSAFGCSPTAKPKDEYSKGDAARGSSSRGTRRRVSSTSAIEVPQSSLSAAASHLNASGTVSTRGIPRLSTVDTLISPRPLGPTHILVVYSSQPSKNAYSRSQKRDGSNTFRDTRRRTIIAPTYNEVIEVPINDLLFLLNAPNLIPTGDSGDLSILPPRLQNEMPKALLFAPHLETFPELVIYLHTKNQAALFRSIIPEWVLDIMHPLPPSPHSDMVLDSEMASTSCGFPKLETSKVKRLFSKLVCDSHRAARSDADKFDFARTFFTVAVELAEIAIQLDLGDRDDPLLCTAAKLTALRDNLARIGYYNKGLWRGLLAYRNITLQALSYRAKVGELAAAATAV